MTDSPAPEGPPPARVFVLDDYEMIRRGLGELMSATSDLVLAGEAASAAEALRELAEVQPDVAIFDIVLPDGNGIDVCREVRSRYPRITCLLLTFHDDEEAQLAAVMAGAAGFLTKQIHGADILDRIRRAVAGESLLDPQATKALLDRLRGIGPSRIPGGSALVAGLTERERQVLDLVAQGRTNPEVARRLALAEETVRTLVAVIFAKLSLARRSQAAGPVGRLGSV